MVDRLRWSRILLVVLVRLILTNRGSFSILLLVFLNWDCGRPILILRSGSVPRIRFPDD